MTPYYRPSGPGEHARVSIDDDQAEGRTEASYAAAMLSLLLQEHGSSQLRLLVFDVVGRLLSVGLVVYLGLVSTFSTPQLLSAVSAAVMVTGFWHWGRNRAIRRIRGVEETLSRIGGGGVERAYIESRFLAESGRRPFDVFLRAEPAVWLWLILALTVVAVSLSGVTS